MSKGKIIAISIISFITVLCIVLFGFVFRLRRQSVEFNNELSITQEEILTTANIKNGKSTLLINKQTAIDNIENTYSNVKVIQIKTVSLFEIKIVVRARYELYYTTNLGKHYVLDEELKVLRITEIEPTNLIKLETSLSVDTNTKECSFIGTDEQKETYLNLYKAMYSAVITTDDAQARIDVCSNITSVKMEENKLIILTPYGVTLDIANPSHELTNKINICYSTIAKLQAEEQTLEGRTIKIFYEVGSSDYKCYISSTESN